MQSRCRLMTNSWDNNHCFILKSKRKQSNHLKFSEEWLIFFNSYSNHLSVIQERLCWCIDVSVNCTQSQWDWLTHTLMPQALTWHAAHTQVQKSRAAQQLRKKHAAGDIMTQLQGFRQILLKNKNHPFDYTYLSNALQCTHHLLSITLI